MSNLLWVPGPWGDDLGRFDDALAAQAKASLDPVLEACLEYEDAKDKQFDDALLAADAKAAHDEDANDEQANEVQGDGQGEAKGQGQGQTKASAPAQGEKDVKPKPRANSLA